MMWSRGWLSRQARESVAFEDVARAVKCQKGALPAKPRSRGYSAARRRRSPLAALEKTRDFENRTYTVGAGLRPFRCGGRNKTPRNNRGRTSLKSFRYADACQYSPIGMN